MIYRDGNALRTLADIEAFEAAAPLAQRLPADTVWAMLRKAAQVHADRTALGFLRAGETATVQRQWTYAQFWQDCCRAARAWQALGVEPPQGVGILLPNLPEVYFATYGAQAVACACALNPLLGAEALGELIRAMACTVLVTVAPASQPHQWEKVLQAVHRSGTVRHIVLVQQDGSDPLPQSADDCRVWDWADLMAKQSAAEPEVAARRGAHDIVARFHTGGTTGAPKVAGHSALNQVYEAWIVAQVLQTRQDDVCLVGLPLFHVHAAVPASLTPFSAGAQVLLAGPEGFRNPVLLQRLWDVVERFRVTVFSAVPSVYSQLLAHAGTHGAPGARSRSLRYVLCGSAPLPRAVLEAFERLASVRMIEGYGLTEGTCVSALNPPAGESRAGSIGLRLPYQQWQIRVPDSTPPRLAAPGERGELWINGPNVFPGYGDPLLTHEVIDQDGWLNTGDIGWIDAEGYAWLCGRSKDVIKRNGHSIDPLRVEEALHRLPDVMAAAVVGTPDERAGEVPVAFVVLRGGADPDGAALLADCARMLADPVAQPVAVRLLDRLPVTAVGKVDKVLLRRMALDDRL